MYLWYYFEHAMKDIYFEEKPKGSNFAKVGYSNSGSVVLTEQSKATVIVQMKFNLIANNTLNV